MTTNPSEEIARLKAKVAQLEAVANHAPRCSVEAAEAVKMRAAKRRALCVDDSLPNDEQALCESEVSDATDVVDLESVVALTNLIGQGAIQDEIGNAATVNSFQHGCFLRQAEVLIEVNREARYGHGGQRVGEASHQDPSQKNRGRAERVSKVGTQSTMVDSDDNGPLLHDRTPGPEVFSLSDDQVGARTRPGCEREHTVSSGEL